MERIGLVAVVVILAAIVIGISLLTWDADGPISATRDGGSTTAEADRLPIDHDEIRPGASRPRASTTTRREVRGLAVAAQTGIGVRDAIVSIRELPAAAVSNVRTAIDGSFVSHALRADTDEVEVWAEAGGSVSPLTGRVAPPDVAVVDVGTLRLIESVAVRGVVRSRDGVPIAGASVYLMPHEVVLSLNQLDMFGVFDRLFAPELVVASRKSDENGVFEFARAAPGAYAVGAFADGYSGLYSDLVLADGGPSLPVDIRLDAGRELTGIVVDGDDRPVEGAELALLSESGRRALMLKTVKARSDAGGRFRFPAIEHRPKILFARAAGFESQAIKGVLPGDDLRVVLSAGVRVSGRVFDVETGVGVPRVRIGVMGYSRPVFASAESDDDGRFTIAHAPADGTRFVIVDHARYDLVMTEAQREDSFMGGMRLDGIARSELGLDLALRRGGTITGRVVDAATDEPLAGVRIAHVGHGLAEGQAATPAPRSAVSDHEGRFVIRGVPPGPVRLSALAGWSTPLQDPAGRPFTTVAADWDARTPIPGIELRVHGPLTISGVVRNDAGPVPGARVRIFSTEWMRAARGSGEAPRRNPLLSRATTTDAEGAFKLGPVPRRRGVTVVATHPEHPEPAELDLKTGDVAINGLELRLDEGASIVGRLVDDEMQPIARVAVSFRCESGSACGAVSNERGEFAISGLPSGPGRMTSASDFWWIDENYSRLTLPRGGTKEVVFELKPAGVISGRFLGDARDGAPVAEIRPAGSSEDPLARIPVGRDGGFRVPRLRPGRLDVTVVEDGHPATLLSLPVTVTVEAFGTAQVELPSVPR